MTKFNYNRLLIVCIIIGLIAAIVVNVQRYNVEQSNKTVDLDGDVIRASLVTIISELAEEDDEILNLEDARQILATNGPAASVMSLIVHEFVE